MPAELRIADGTPLWASSSIVPSRDRVVSPGSSPALAAIHTDSTDVFSYVKVENVGTVDLGECDCAAAVPAAWPGAIFFAGYRAGPPTASVSEQRFGTTFTQTPSGSSIVGPGVSYYFGHSPGQRAWDWSPDGRLFAYVASTSPAGADWYLTIVALQDVTRSDGSIVRRDTAAVSGAPGVFSGAWNNGAFGWMHSRAVSVKGTAPGGGLAMSVVCPLAPGNNSWGTVMPLRSGEIDWVFLVSPCGSVVALVPRILVQPNSGIIGLVSTANARETQFLQNNRPTAVTVTGRNPTITTVQHTAEGVEIATGGGTVTVDDPDCTNVAGGGVVARVDRVKASTLPSANLGVLSVGSAVASLIEAGRSAWVQVPNVNAAGWGNQGERHWCLLAQAYTADGSTIARPWDGQAPSPRSFPVTLRNCAQRNVMIA